MNHLLFSLFIAATGCATTDDCTDSSCGEERSIDATDGDGGITNPAADDDDDGFSNEEEDAAGTNPNYAFSRPYAGGYNVGFCDTPPEPTGPTGVGANENGVIWAAYQEGDVAENWTMVDHHGEQVDLYSFCGKTVMISLSAGWCGPCRSLAAQMQAMQDEYRADGLQIIEVITGDNQNNPPSMAFLEDWSADYNFRDIPVLLGPEPTSWDSLMMQWETDQYIPTVYIVGPDGTVLSADQGVHDPATFLP